MCCDRWMNEWCIYIALYCVLLYTQSALQSCGGGGGLSSTITSVQHPLGWWDGCYGTTASVRSPHTSYRWRGERVIEPIKWMGNIRRPWLTRASGGNLTRTPGLHPTLYEKCHGIFNDHRESGPRFNVSSEKRCLLTVVSPSPYWALGPTLTTGWAPPAGLTNTSSSSNLVFSGGLPSRYWPGSALLSFSGQTVLGSSSSSWTDHLFLFSYSMK